MSTSCFMEQFFSLGNTTHFDVNAVLPLVFFRVANKPGSHMKDRELTELNDLFTYITEKHVQAFELYENAEMFLEEICRL